VSHSAQDAGSDAPTGNDDRPCLLPLARGCAHPAQAPVFVFAGTTAAYEPGTAYTDPTKHIINRSEFDRQSQDNTTPFSCGRTGAKRRAEPSAATACYMTVRSSFPLQSPLRSASARVSVARQQRAREGDAAPSVALAASVTDAMAGEVDEPLEPLVVIRSDDVAVFCLINASSFLKERTRTTRSGSATSWPLVLRECCARTQGDGPVLFAHREFAGASGGPFCSSGNLRQNRWRAY